MRENDKSLIEWPDVPRALGLLTRLPVAVDGTTAAARGAAAVWAYPLAGVAVGLISVMTGALMLLCGLPHIIAALGVAAAQVIVTGAMHEDGLADCADGFWGGYDPTRRLEIMKDSRIGSYGVIALILTLALRVAAIDALIGAEMLLAGVLAAAGLSRGAMVAVMRALPHARPGGLSATVGRPGGSATGLAILLAVISGIWVGAGAVLAMAAAAGFAAIAVALLARAKIGGQTGDVLGATQQISDIAALLALLADFP